jgi:hypothetical protein
MVWAIFKKNIGAIFLQKHLIALFDTSGQIYEPIPPNSAHL